MVSLNQRIELEKCIIWRIIMNNKDPLKWSRALINGKNMVFAAYRYGFRGNYLLYSQSCSVMERLLFFMDERLQSLQYSGKECYRFPLELTNLFLQSLLRYSWIVSNSHQLWFHFIIHYIHYLKQFDILIPLNLLFSSVYILK